MKINSKWRLCDDLRPRHIDDWVKLYPSASQTAFDQVCIIHFRNMVPIVLSQHNVLSNRTWGIAEFYLSLKLAITIAEGERFYSNTQRFSIKSIRGIPGTVKWGCRIFKHKHLSTIKREMGLFYNKRDLSIN